MSSHNGARTKIMLAAVLWFAVSAAAQSEERFKIRLSTVPIDAAMRASVAGSGSGTATLAGNKLTINAAFEGLPGPATLARLHRGVAPGVRGSAFFDLTLTKAAKGTAGGTFTLTPEQVDSLRKGRLYIQIASEPSPEGTLWGWILK